MVKSIKIATWNINGLAKYPQEIKTFIFSQNIDILLVSETHFTN
jgi:exonuclease III